jgi:hypothetical protein
MWELIAKFRREPQRHPRHDRQNRHRHPRRQHHALQERGRCRKPACRHDRSRLDRRRRPACGRAKEPRFVGAVRTGGFHYRDDVCLHTSMIVLDSTSWHLLPTLKWYVLPWLEWSPHVVGSWRIAAAAWIIRGDRARDLAGVVLCRAAVRGARDRSQGIPAMNDRHDRSR